MGVTNNVSIYFPVYKKIEKEIQELASAIYFCDEQKNVFSLDIADLIVRCLVEIESIAKDIYRIENALSGWNRTGIYQRKRWLLFLHFSTSMR